MAMVLAIRLIAMVTGPATAIRLTGVTDTPIAPIGSPMSALGQKRTSRPLEGTSALPPEADIGTQSGIVRFVPKADILPAVLSVELIVQPDAHDVVGEIGVCVNSSLTPLIRLS